MFVDAEHKYPYDWRTKKPTIFRATEQWFASVEGFRHTAMSAIGNVKWFPPQVLNVYLYIDSLRDVSLIIFGAILHKYVYCLGRKQNLSNDF